MAKNGTTTNNLFRAGSTDQVQIGNAFVTADNSASVKNSPLTVSSSVLTIVPPDNAVEFIVNPSADMKISNDLTMTTYDVIASGTKESVPCAKMSAIYIVRSSGDLTLNFRFTVI